MFRCSSAFFCILFEWFSEVNNFTGALQERVNTSEAVEWLLKQLRSSAPEVLQFSDNSGRRRNCCDVGLFQVNEDDEFVDGFLVGVLWPSEFVELTSKMAHNFCTL